VAHTYDIGTDRGRVRLGLADTRARSAQFTDAEIDHFLAIGGTVDEAINEGLRVLMAAASARGDASRAAALRVLLQTRGGEMPTVGVDFPSALPMDDAYVEP